MDKPAYGSITTRVDEGDSATITREGYHGHLPRTRKIWFEESTIVTREILLSSIMPGLDDFLNGKVQELDFEFRMANGKIRLVKRTLVE